VVVDRFQPNNPSYAIIAIRGGNPKVGPEKADTLTFGAVYQPGWLPGFAMSADYFDIRIDDAIATLGVQVVLDRCLAGDESLCSRITRSAISNQVVTINNAYLNIAEARSRGIDAEVSYRNRLKVFGGEEGVAFRLFANRAIESSTTNFNEAKIDRVGQTGLPGGAPRWQVNASLAYERGPLQVTLQERVISHGT
ncbi:TonB-dependent receptor, partial [bacterium]